MLKLTNPQDAFKFVSFLDIALPYINLMTPTRISAGGTAAFAQMFSDKLNELEIKHKIWAVLQDKPGEHESSDNFREFMNSGDIELLKKSACDLVFIDIGGVLYDYDGNNTGKVIIKSRYIKSDPTEMIFIKRSTLDLMVEHCDFNQIYDKETMPVTRQLFDEVFEMFDYEWDLDFNDGKGPKMSENTINVRKRKEKEGLERALKGLIDKISNRGEDTPEHDED